MQSKIDLDDQDEDEDSEDGQEEWKEDENVKDYDQLNH
jgi:hypothetical protein